MCRRGTVDLFGCNSKKKTHIRTLTPQTDSRNISSFGSWGGKVVTITEAGLTSCQARWRPAAAAVSTVIKQRDAVLLPVFYPTVNTEMCCVQGHSWLAAGLLVSVQSFMERYVTSGQNKRWSLSLSHCSCCIKREGRAPRLLWHNITGLKPTVQCGLHWLTCFWGCIQQVLSQNQNYDSA